MHDVLFFCCVFLVIFGLNVLPAFAPATWTVISYITIRYGANILLLAVVGALAATLGRVMLARLSHLLIRRKLLSEKTKKNLDSIRVGLESRKVLTVGAFLFYAVSPLPSNNLFIAYGLTTMRLRMIAIPFLLGRVSSYSFWALTASGVARRLGYDGSNGRAYFSYYFIGGQVVTLAMVYVFARIDWKRAFTERRLGWLK